MIRRLLLALGLCLAAGAANATCVLPFTLVSGTLADASQVMANYNALNACINALPSTDFTTTGIISTSNTTQSTNNITGALVVAGGAGFGKDIFTLGAINASGAIASGGIISGTGAAFSGGVGINLNAAAIPPFLNVASVKVFGVNGGQGHGIASIGNGGVNGLFVGATARGTGASPSAVQTGDILTVFGSGGYGATQYFAGSGGMTVRAADHLRYDRGRRGAAGPRSGRSNNRDDDQRFGGGFADRGRQGAGDAEC